MDGVENVNVQDIKTLIELQFLQGLSTNQTSNDSSSTSGLFQQLLLSFLNDQTNTSTISNTLGTINSLAKNLDGTTQSNTNNFSLNYPTISPKIPNISLTGSAQKYEKLIGEAAEKYNIPAKLLTSIIKHESNFDETATSHVGASGLMQLMPSTAKWLGVKNIYDPTENVMAGAKYLRQMLDKYDQNTTLALAAYNAGPGNVDKYNGIPPFKEPQNYVKKVLNTYQA